MKKNKIILPKPNTNENVDTLFSSRYIYIDDEKNGILNIVKIKHNYTDKVKTKTSSDKVKTKTSSDKVKTKTSSDKVKTKTSSDKVKTKSLRY